MSLPDDQLSAITTAMAAGQPIDWDLAETQATDDSVRGAIRELRVIAGILELHRSSPQPAPHNSTPHPSSVDVSLAPTATIGRWGPLLLVGRIGKGAYGEVYRAWDPRLQRDVALKLIPTTGPVAKEAEHLVDEARLLAKVRHPNVVTIHGAEWHDGAAGIWMEYIQGQTLEDVLVAHGPLSAQEAGVIGVVVCRALAAVHRAGVIHRDIKAQNVMRETGGRLLLMDFGTGLDVTQEPVEGLRISGTPLYVAPEILEGSSPGPASDVYSLGVLMYHLVTGGYPVVAESLDALRDAHLRGERTLLRDARPDLPAPFVAAVEQAMARQPERRFATAGAFEGALAQAVPATDDAQASPVPASVSETTHRRWRWRTAGLAFAALLFAVAVSWAVLGTNGQRTRTPDPADGSTPSAFASAPGLKLRQVPTPTWMYTGRPSPDGRLLPFSDRDGNLGLFEFDSGAIRMLTNKGDSDEHAESHMTVSPDGASIAYTWATLDGAYELRTVGTNGRRPRVVLRDPDVFYPGPIQWSHDGSEILTTLEMADGSTRVAMVGAEAGTTRVLRTLATAPFWASLSPDAAFVALVEPVEGEARLRIVILDAASGAETGVIDDVGTNEAPFWLDAETLLFVSDRMSTPALWQTSVRQGKPAGSPAVVYRDFLRAIPIGLTEHGSLFYFLQTGLVDVFVAPADFATDRVIGEPEPIAPGLVGSRSASAWSPDGRRLAFVASRGGIGRGRQGLVVRDLESGTETALHPALGFVGPPRWSPDGRTILIDGHDPRGAYGVYLVDVATGDARLALPGARDGQMAIGTVIWGSTGDTLWVDRIEDGLYERELDTGREEKLIDYRAEGLLKLTQRPEALRLSPDRRWLAFSSFLRDDPDTMVLKVKSTESNQPSIELLRRTMPDRFAIKTWSPDAQELLVATFSLAQPGPRREQELFRLRLDDPTPRPTGFTVPGARAFDLSPDGRWVTFTTGQEMLQLWVMDGLRH